MCSFECGLMKALRLNIKAINEVYNLKVLSANA